jgi:hypothetical protein
MGKDICVGVAFQAHRIIDGLATQHQLPVFGEFVGVKPLAYSHEILLTAFDMASLIHPLCFVKNGISRLGYPSGVHKPASPGFSFS